MWGICDEHATVGLLISAKTKDSGHAVSNPTNMNLFLCLYYKGSGGSREKDIELHLVISPLGDSFLEVLVSDDPTRVILPLVKVFLELIIKDIGLSLYLTLLLRDNLFHFILESDVSLYLTLVLVIHLLFVELIVIRVAPLRVLFVNLLL